MEWLVEYDEKVTNEGNSFGSTHFRKQRIFLEESETQQKKEQVLIHEILHVIWYQAGLGVRYKDQEKIEEEIVTTLSQGIYQVFKDNDLIK